MQYEDAAGRSMTEFFTTKEGMEKRQKMIEDLGGKVIRKVELHVNPKYPKPHQGAQEIERRRKRIEQLNQRIADEEAKAKAAI